MSWLSKIFGREKKAREIIEENFKESQELLDSIGPVYRVFLVQVSESPDRVNMIQLVRRITGLGLKESKSIVDKAGTKSGGAFAMSAKNPDVVTRNYLDAEDYGYEISC